MKVIAIVGYHNSGKTSLIEVLVKMLTEKGFKVGYIKHDPKGHAQTDREDKDTGRIFKWAPRVVLSQKDKLTLWDKMEDDPVEIIGEFFRGFDVVILEGFKAYRDIPKIAVGDVEASSVILRVEGKDQAGHIIELLERMEDNFPW